MTHQTYSNLFKEITKASSLGATVVRLDGTNEAITLDLAAEFVNNRERFSHICYPEAAIKKYGFTMEELMGDNYYLFDPCVQGRGEAYRYEGVERLKVAKQLLENKQ